MFWHYIGRHAFWRLLPLLPSLWGNHGMANNCAVYIAQYERTHAIPGGLLQAISKVESGRKGLGGKVVAWPWTINANGKADFFPTKEAAIAAVRKLQLGGMSSIDVGCMQVNLHHHPHAFQSLEEAFDPLKNVAYAARFLKGLKNEHTSWHKAVAHYHSANPLHHIPYHRHVMNAWKREKGGGVRPGDLLLAAGRFKMNDGRNRIRRLSSARTLPLRATPTAFHPPRQGVVRRISSHHSRHIRRLRKQ